MSSGPVRTPSPCAASDTAARGGRHTNSGFALGALFGLLHGLFAGTALVNVLPVLHPRMGTPQSAADSQPLLEAPRFLMLNYGRQTPVVSVVAHIAYGAIVGGFISLAS